MTAVSARFPCSALGATLMLLAAGCASAGDGPPPGLRAAAAKTRSGEEAYLAGRPGDAVPPLTEAARLYFAAGDLPGASRALLNLALAERAAGQGAAATATAVRLRGLTASVRQQVRDQGGKEESAAEPAVASAWLDALLALDRRDPAAAVTSLDSVAGKFSGSSPWPGRLENLRAELALGDGRLAEALGHARAGQAACAAAGDRAEEARAQRLAGAAHVQLGQWSDARTRYLAALKLEESLGGGQRMAGDLRQLALVATRLGDAAGSRLYTERAEAISAAGAR